MLPEPESRNIETGSKTKLVFFASNFFLHVHHFVFVFSETS